MAREEERLGVALEFYDKHKFAASNITLVDSFVYGRKWADKTMIDKASEWLKLNLLSPKYIHPILVNYLIENFRKAMEE